MPTTFAKTIDGNDIFAKRAECDAAGNDLSTTYATKNELPDGVPAVTSSDDGKVLKASYTGGTGSFSWEAESGGTVTDVEVDGTSVVSGGVASITMPTELVPTVTSSDDGKVLKAAYSGGTGSYSWETESGGGGADWDAQSGEPGYIENKPVPKTLVAGTGITITESSTELTVASTNQLYSAGNGLTLNNATFAVDTSVVATQNDIPTVDQTYDGTSANPQSGTAVADAIGNLGTNLSAAQLLALKQALGVDETVLFENSAGIGTGTQLVLSEAYTNFEKLQFTYRMWNEGDCVDVDTFGTTLPRFNLTSGWASSSLYALFVTQYTASDSTHLSVTKCGFNNVTGGAWTTTNANYRLYKVVGIHRVASN